jgi:hypothetical protein
MDRMKEHSEINCTIRYTLFLTNFYKEYKGRFSSDYHMVGVSPANFIPLIAGPRPMSPHGVSIEVCNHLHFMGCSIPEQFHDPISGQILVNSGRRQTRATHYR